MLRRSDGSDGEGESVFAGRLGLWVGLLVSLLYIACAGTFMWETWPLFWKHEGLRLIMFSAFWVFGVFLVVVCAIVAGACIRALFFDARRGPRPTSYLDGDEGDR